MRYFFLTVSFLIWHSITPSSAASSSANQNNEVRIGIMKNDIGNGLKQRHERSPDLNFEYLVKPWSTGLGYYIFSPRPHMGMSINTRGGTHQLYVGLTWRINLSNFFIEPSFGGEIHSAHLKTPSAHKRALGSRFLFREAIAVGYQFTEKHSASLMLDHASNAGIAKPNGGITTIGIRYGYRL